MALLDRILKFTEIVQVQRTLAEMASILAASPQISTTVPARTLSHPLKQIGGPAAEQEPTDAD